jgi:Predicted glycosyltransferases
MLKKIRLYLKKNNGISGSIKAFSDAIKEHGGKNVIKRSLGIPINETLKFKKIEYSKWCDTYEKKYTQSEIDSINDNLQNKPLISFLVPVYNVEERYLRACIDSILAQYYQNWELCIADDCSTAPYIRPLLTAYMQKDSRIKVVFREENGHISKATNSALSIANGEYIAFVDNDDVILPQALLEVVKLINEHPDADMIYSDEDKINDIGNLRSSPFFKPDWSPDAFWSHMYCCHFNVYRKEIADRIGGLRVGFEGAQDYDFVFRFTEQTTAIYHLPQVLYHWRMIPTSTASGIENKNYAYHATIKAKQDALKRRNYNGFVETSEGNSNTNVVFLPEESDFVSIIIPTKNHGNDVKKCIASIYDKSSWKNFEIILVNNGSDEEESLQIFTELDTKYNSFQILDMPIPFNYSKLNNAAAKIARGNFLLFLNNDTEVITNDWLERLIGQAKLPYCGAVGAKLLYENETIQHSGVIIIDNGPVHAFSGYDKKASGYFSRLDTNYNYLAVTGACLLIEKRKFTSVGGFDETLPVTYNDVELCINVYDKGFYNVVRNDVQLYHYESLTRGSDTEAAEKMQRLISERDRLMNKWSKYYHNDPFYNPNLTRTNIDFSLIGLSYKKMK